MEEKYWIYVDSSNVGLGIPEWQYKMQIASFYWNFCVNVWASTTLIQNGTIKIRKNVKNPIIHEHSKNKIKINLTARVVADLQLTAGQSLIMSDKLVSRSSSRRARKIVSSNDLSDLSPIKSKKNELTIGDNDYFNDANMDLSKFEKATEQRTKTQVEEERELVKKATRANERLLTKIHEASTKSTLKEAEYTMKVYFLFLFHFPTSKKYQTENINDY